MSVWGMSVIVAADRSTTDLQTAGAAKPKPAFKPAFGFMPRALGVKREVCVYLSRRWALTVQISQLVSIKPGRPANFPPESATIIVTRQTHIGFKAGGPNYLLRFMTERNSFNQIVKIVQIVLYRTVYSIFIIKSP
jgi:hypothetical protein